MGMRGIVPDLGGDALNVHRRLIRRVVWRGQIMDEHRTGV